MDTASGSDARAVDRARHSLAHDLAEEAPSTVPASASASAAPVPRVLADVRRTGRALFADATLHAYGCKPTHVQAAGVFRGWEVTCYEQGHRSGAEGQLLSRCTRTRRFPQGGSEEAIALVARRLCWWAQQCSRCGPGTEHRALPDEPPDGILPSLDQILL